MSERRKCFECSRGFYGGGDWNLCNSCMDSALMLKSDCHCAELEEKLRQRDEAEAHKTVYYEHTIEKLKAKVERLRYKEEARERDNELGVAGKYIEELETESEKDKEIEGLREAIRNVPTEEYGEAERDGCDASGAWDCFIEKLDKWEEQTLKERE